MIKKTMLVLVGFFCVGMFGVYNAKSAGIPAVCQKYKIKVDSSQADVNKLEASINDLHEEMAKCGSNTACRNKCNKRLKSKLAQLKKMKANLWAKKSLLNKCVTEHGGSIEPISNPTSKAGKGVKAGCPPGQDCSGTLSKKERTKLMQSKRNKKETSAREKNRPPADTVEKGSKSPLYKVDKE